MKIDSSAGTDIKYSLCCFSPSDGAELCYSSRQGRFLQRFLQVSEGFSLVNTEILPNISQAPEAALGPANPEVLPCFHSPLEVPSLVSRSLPQALNTANPSPSPLLTTLMSIPKATAHTLASLAPSARALLSFPPTKLPILLHHVLPGLPESLWPL